MKKTMRMAESDIDRFWEKVEVKGDDECWPWKASQVGTTGYGQFRLNEQKPRAHRIAWFIANGTIPEGLKICHSCDNTLCCNPAHLWAGTQKENIRDMISKGRGRYAICE